MFRYNTINRKAILLLLQISIVINCLYSQTQKFDLKAVIEFSDTVLPLKKCLDEINSATNFNIVYGGSKEFRKYEIVLKNRKQPIESVFELIKDQAPVEIVIDGDYIIVKLRDLEKSYHFKGKIFDDKTGESLVGVNIYSKNYNIGTVSDNNGNFNLSLLPDKYLFVFSSVGYTQKILTITLFNDVQMDINLTPSETEIQAVKITGAHDEFEKLKIGRTIEKIEAKVVNNLNTNDINDALQGRINGVWVTKVSGAPGDHNKIRIRGISSIFGSTDPLYVVDGMIIPIVNFKSLGISDINSHDVEKITVLKDASSTALYGYLGGNGVIDIETKKGGGNREFNFSAKGGIQYTTQRYDFLNSEEFIKTLLYSDTLLNTRFFYIRKSQHIYEKYPYYEDTMGNTLGSDDFQDLLFRNGAVNEYQLSGKGSLKSIDYYISGNYYSHKGIIENTQYNKYTFAGNFSRSFREKAIVRLMYKGNYQENKNNLDNFLGNKSILRGINYEPAYYTTPDSFKRKSERLFINNLNYTTIETLSNFTNTFEDLIHNELRQKDQFSNSFTANTGLRLGKSLQLKTNHSLAFRELDFTSWIKSSDLYLSSKENYVIFSQQYDMVFDRKLGNHKFNAFLRYKNYQDNIYWKVDSVKNVDIDNFTRENDIYLRGSQSIFGEKGSVRRVINSTIASCVSYNYREKYFLSFLLNHDNIKEGYYVDNNELFPSVALNWNLSKEKILHFPKWINSFNIYMNWGKSGNYPLNALSNDLFTESEYYTNGENAKAMIISNLADHYLEHEEIIETNYGIDFSLFRNRLTLSGDYFIKYNNNLLIKRQTPFYYGGGESLDNVGKMENRGIEMSLEATPIDRPGLYWSTRFGYSSNDQLITKLYNDSTINFNHTDLLYPDFYVRERERLGSITGYKTVGLWNDSIHAQKEDEPFPEFVNVNGLAYIKTDTLTLDGLVEEDKVVIGNSIPKFTMNWLNYFEYKNFSCEMLWYGVFGVDKFNATRASTYITGINADVQSIVSDTLDYIMSESFYESSYFIEDASFIRLKNLSFTYRQTKKIASKISVSYTLSFENILTITKYSGYDPESTVYTYNNFSDNAIDRGAYPTPKSVFATINFKF